MGPETRSLESEFASYLGVRHAVAVANGTAALHLALLALGTEPGDEVLTPSLTFVAAANAILHARGIPRFADVQAHDHPLVSAETLEKARTPATRGVCVMHYGGYPCAMGEILEWARGHRFWIIEDAAHAPGASWETHKCGTLGDIGCFSFFGNKNITCAEGGMIVTQRDDIAMKLRALRSHGMNSLTWERFNKEQISYDVTLPGFNYRMDDLRASLLRIQLKSLSSIQMLRQERTLWYRERLRGDSRWILPFADASLESAFHLFTIVLREGISREKLILYLRDLGIQTSIHYPPVHQFSYYREMGSSTSVLPVTESLGQRLLTLPLYPGMSEKQVDFVCGALQKAVVV